MATRDFDEFYRSEYAGLVGFATVLVGRRGWAEDLVQEAMVESYRRWERVGGYDSPRAWVRRSVVQRSIKVTKKRSNEQVAQLRAREPEPSDTPDVGLDTDVLACVQALPHQQRAAVALHYLEDCSVRQIADELGVAEGTVKAHLSRGRSAMADSLRRLADERGGPHV